MEVSRRTVLVAASTVPLLAGLTGCGVRIGTPPPSGEASPPRDPAAAGLIAERERVAAALAIATGVDDPFARALRPVHTDQLGLLDDAFARLVPPLTPGTAEPTGVAPGESSPAVPAPTPPATPSGPGAAPTPPTLADLGRVEAAGLDAPQAWEELSPRFASLLVGSVVQRAVAHDLIAAALGRPAEGDGDVASGEPRPTSIATPEIGADLLAAHRSAAYGIEVAAAHLPDPRRTAATTALHDLRRVEEDLIALLPDAEPRPLGFALPGDPVTTAEQATVLLHGVLDRLVQVIIAAAGPTAEALGQADAPALPDALDEHSGGGGPVATLVDLARGAEVARVRCGGALAPGVLPRTSPPTDRPDPAGTSQPTAGGR